MVTLTLNIPIHLILTKQHLIKVFVTFNDFALKESNLQNEVLPTFWQHKRNERIKATKYCHPFSSLLHFLVSGTTIS